MTLYKEWQQLLQNLDETNYKKFVKEYSEGETRIYKDILANHDEVLTGILKDLAAKYEVRPIIFMAFVDGINDSLTVPHDLESVTEDTELEFHIDFKELYKNMYKNNADYLYSLEEWNQVYSTDELEEIYKEYRRSKTIVKEKKPGRNAPCPCGSGKKYKNCCGKNN